MTTTPQSISILAVDDSKSQAEYLRLLLEKHGFTVRLAGDGKEALAAIKAELPSLVISDIVMPEMDGYELCGAIRAAEDEAIRVLPVVLLTQLSSPSDILRALQCGADNFITKPYNEEYLLSRMESILEGIKRRNSDRSCHFAEVVYKGERFRVTAEHQRILDLLFSTYEATVIRNQELQETQKVLSEKVYELETALARVKQLEGIIPICMHCKNIRDDKNSWQQIEQYIFDHSDVQFSHGICPDCLKKYYSDI